MHKSLSQQNEQRPGYRGKAYKLTLKKRRYKRPGPATRRCVSAKGRGLAQVGSSFP
jgi:hypothetical protein